MSGWNQQFAKLPYGFPYRGFESPSFRTEGKSLREQLTGWSIHLMVRIQDSQSWHRGSIPLSTTKRSPFGLLFFGFYANTFFYIFLYSIDYTTFYLKYLNETGVVWAHGKIIEKFIGKSLAINNNYCKFASLSWKQSFYLKKGLIPIEDRSGCLWGSSLYFFAYLFGRFKDFLYLCARFSPWWLKEVVAQCDTPCGKTR